MNTSRNRQRRGSSNLSRGRTFSSSKPRRGKFSSGRFHSSRSEQRQPFRNAGRQGHGGGRGGRKMPSFDPSRFINQNPVDNVGEIFKPKHSFGSFGLHENLLKAVTTIGLNTPSPIQDQIIPEILEGKDVIGLAETGTGKTAAFLIPLIEKTLKGYNKQTLILAPTRELAIQIDNEFKLLAKNFRLYSVVCVGGVNIRPQIRDLKRKSHFVIGTPGRILDLLNRKDFMPMHITSVVLDEADRMLDMGFINDIKSILSKMPADRKTLFFSATMPADARRLVHDFLRNPVTISVKKKDVIDSIEQNVVRVSHNNKFDTLLKLLGNREFSRVLIFGSMKHSVQKLAKQLAQYGIKTDAIHGNKTHGQRQRALTQFKKGHVRVLVATDVAARGIHVEDISHVINYDLPHTFEDYVHRIGRTGRADKRGKALTFIPA
jgi:ATP-dependent RNA helicase RhlE